MDAHRGARVSVLTAVAVLTVGLASLAGTWAGHRSTSVDRPGVQGADVRVGPAELVVPAEWRAAALSSAGIPGLPAGRALAFVPTPGLAGRAIVLFASIDDASLVPRAFRSSMTGARSRPRAARLGGRLGWSYDGVTAAGSNRVIGVTVTPTSSGVLAVACTSPELEWPVTEDCASEIESVEVHGAAALVPSSRVAVALRVPAVLHRLDRERVAYRALLAGAPTAEGQTLAARRLAADHAVAAAALRPLTGRSGASLVHDLTSVHDAYAALALAAHDRSASAFGAASGAVRLTEARLAWAVTAVPQPVTP